MARTIIIIFPRITVTRETGSGSLLSRADSVNWHLSVNSPLPPSPYPPHARVLRAYRRTRPLPTIASPSGSLNPATDATVAETTGGAAASARSDRRSYITDSALPRLYHEVIGLAFVVDEGGGPRLALRYPWTSGGTTTAAAAVGGGGAGGHQQSARRKSMSIEYIWHT